MPTYKLIASSTVGSGGASSITFSSIPQTYTDLVLKLSSRSSATVYVDNVIITFNSSSTGYSERLLINDSGTVGSYNRTGSNLQWQYAVNSGQTASTFGNCEIYIPNYASSNNKSASVDSVTENNSSTNITGNFTASLWSNTSAITSINLSLAGGNFVQYCSAYLYGISNA